jgi:hypothetical protein
MSLPGKTLYHLWHRPINRVVDLVRAGGPWQERRTRAGEEEMRRAAVGLPPLPEPKEGNGLEVHLLTGARFWHQTAFCLASLSRCGAAPRPVFYDDGTLDGSLATEIHRFAPFAVLESRAACEQRLHTALPAARFPRLHIRKLIDPHLRQPTGWKLVIDSDLLFFRRPSFLLDWAAAPDRPLHAVDCETSYGYPRALLDSLAGTPLAERVNVGLAGLRSDTLDWEEIERACATLLDAPGHPYLLEQALVALLVAGRPCAVAPPADYVTAPRPPEAQACRAVMHHYVAHSKRWYFQTNWRKILSAQP